jgi:uncharacterized protein YndB with AHSA1/START domain
MSATSETSLRLVRVYAAPRDRVWHVFTAPEQVARWYAPGDMKAVVHQWDVRPGGRFAIDMGESSGTTQHAYGTFLEVVPGRRLVQTWRWRAPVMDPVESRLVIEFKDVRGGTEVVLVHERLTDAKSVEVHTQGWVGCLDNLARVLGAGPDTPRPSTTMR